MPKTKNMAKQNAEVLSMYMPISSSLKKMRAVKNAVADTKADSPLKKVKILYIMVFQGFDGKVLYL